LALDNASLRVRAGTVHALLGENGAGKTTLMRIAFGLLRADAGTVSRNGIVVRITSPTVAHAAGIGMVHQHFTLVPAMTVAENIALGGHGLYHPKAAATHAFDVARRTGLAIEPEATVQSLTISAQQRCEIVKALARNVSILIMDEPTSVLAPAEAQELLRWIRQFADAGNAVVLITHKLRDALSVSDDVTVLHRGRTVLSSSAATVTEASLATAMLGGDARATQENGAHASVTHAPSEAVVGAGAIKSAAIVLEARHLALRDSRGITRVRDVSLTVHGGEIVGVVAIEGSGQRELLRALAGRLRPSQGTLTLPDDVGFVPEDRHRDALLLDDALSENVALRGAGARAGIMSWRAIREETVAIVARHDVRASDVMSRARDLSGGNQQKLVLGRELANDPVALVVENPTRGLDFRATQAVHEELRRASQRGAAVVVYSSDIDEVLALADRVLALHDGVLTEVARDRGQVGRAMLGTA
jgi:simple sugar transport system ATP-binding protein